MIGFYAGYELGSPDLFSKHFCNDEDEERATQTSSKKKVED
jgi:hypothetical protein